MWAFMIKVLILFCQKHISDTLCRKVLSSEMHNMTYVTHHIIRHLKRERENIFDVSESMKSGLLNILAHYFDYISVITSLTLRDRLISHVTEDYACCILRSLYFVSSRERPWRHWACPRIHAARRIHYASIPVFLFEHVKKLRARRPASSSGIRADVTVVLDMRQSIAILILFHTHT